MDSGGPEWLTDRALEQFREYETTIKEKDQLILELTDMIKECHDYCFRRWEEEDAKV